MIYEENDEYERYQCRCKKCNIQFLYDWPTLDMRHNFDRCYVCQKCQKKYFINLYDTKELFDTICKNKNNDNDRCDELAMHLPCCSCGGILVFTTNRCPICHNIKNTKMRLIAKINEGFIRIESSDIKML